ncbi:MAG: ABC transporter permease [Kiritimatiellae bacterium]|nr:ABC transporter permease [Kiritimatiellia bacterium]
MLRYAISRTLQVIPTTVGILLLTFLLFHVVGGSPAKAVLGKNADAAAIAAFDRKFGYDKPLVFAVDSQFVRYITNLAKGDFGISSEYGEPVSDILKRGAMPSLTLTVPILVCGTLVALALALVCAAFRGAFADRAILLFSTVLMSVNYVVWVVAGQFLLAFKAEAFPVWGYESAFYLALPVIIGVVSGLGTDVRFFRTAIIDEIYKPYVRTAQSKGLSRMHILLRHVLPNAMIPVITYISLSIPFLFTGSLLLESFFGIPGLGSVSINAIHSSDMAVVRAIVVVGALLYQFVNLATDLAYAALDPRIRLKN